MQASRLSVPAGAAPHTFEGMSCGSVFTDPKSIEGRSLDEMDGEGLRRAGRSVTGCIWEDCRLPDPAEMVTKSALDDGAREMNPAMQNINEGLVRLSRLIVIPEMLLSQYTDKSRCFMGLMAPIGRAWMTADEKLFLWDFKGSRDVAMWASDESFGPIIDVQLVRPKKGIFVEAIKWLIVVVTPVEIRILGTQFEQNGDLVLHDTKLVFGTDQVSMVSTVGTDDGRIFCGGADGHVYELEYEAEEGWFTRRCRKVNRTGSVLARLAPTFLKTSSSGRSPNAIVSLKYDGTRHALWTLTDGGQMDMFVLSGDGWAHMTTLHFNADEMHRQHPGLLKSSIGERLVGIHPISRDESIGIVLLAVTSSGLRLYYGIGSPSNMSDIRLVGMKAPQPFGDLKSASTAGSRASKFNLPFLAAAASMANAHASYHRSGMFVAAGALSDDEDILSVRSIRFNDSAESSSEWRLEGRVWEVAEAIDEGSLMLPVPGADRMSNWWADLVQGHRVLPRQLLCLTNAGMGMHYLFGY